MLRGQRLTVNDLKCADYRPLTLRVAGRDPGADGPDTRVQSLGTSARMTTSGNRAAKRRSRSALGMKRIGSDSRTSRSRMVSGRLRHLDRSPTPERQTWRLFWD